jgi:hypothetical protein
MDNWTGGRARSVERDLGTMNWRRIRKSAVRTPGGRFAGPLRRLTDFLAECRYRVRVALTVPPLASARSQQSKRTEENRVRLAHEYSEGYIAGWRECFDACLQAVEDEFASRDDAWQLGASLIGSGESRQDN